MTAATVPTKPTAPPLAAALQRKPKVGFGDLVWLTVRQHRVALILTTAAYVLFAVVVLGWSRVSIGDWQFDPKYATPLFAGIIAVFWGAPLLSSEYDQHTNLFIWGQDVSPMRWMLAKVGLLGTAIVVLSGGLDLIVDRSIAETPLDNAVLDYRGAYGSVGFESWLPLAIAYALFGFALGVAAGAVFRRSVTSIAVTLFGFAGFRFLVNLGLRPYLLANLVTPVRSAYPTTALVTPILNGPPEPGANDYIVNFWLWLNPAGKVMPEPTSCELSTSSTGSAYTNCLRKLGITQNATDFQPLSRVHLFQSVELALYVVLIVVLLVVAFRLVRRNAAA